MAILTKKFSEFAVGDIADSARQTVGLQAGLNVRDPYFITWTLSGRPVAPYAGLLGYNSTLEQYEFWDQTSMMWVALASGAGVGVTNVATGTGLTGGPITTTGTISFAAIAANSLWANVTGASAVPTVIPTSTFLLSASNLSDVPNKATARTNLGLAIGTNVEAWNLQLDEIAANIWPGQTSITTLGTVTTGLWNAAVVTVPFGGSGNSSFTAYSVLCAGTTATGVFQNVSGLGSIGQVLTSNGAGLLPTWQNAGTGTINSGSINELAYYAAAGTTLSGLATANNGTLITSAGGAPSISQTLPAAVQGNITALGTVLTGVWNATPVTVPFGGTGNTTFTAYSLICAGTTATGTFQNVVGVGSIGQVLTSNGAAVLPSWQSVSGSGTVNSGLQNQLAYYAANGTAVSGLTTANEGVLVTSIAGVPSILAGSGISGTPLMAVNGAAPAWSAISYPSIAGTSGKILISDGSNVVYSTPTYPNSATSTGSFIYANGTNFVASTSLWPNTVGTSGKIVISDGTNNVYSTPTYPNAAGTSGNVMTSNGTNFVSSTPTYVTTVNVQPFSSNGTYTPTSGMKYCIIECIGPGGGGGGVALSTQMGSGGGGGGGGYSKKYASAATIGASQTVTVGTGGAGGAAGNNNGSNGSGATSVGTICVANAGSLGTGSAANGHGTGGAGGTAGTGDIATVGNGGSPGSASASTNTPDGFAGRGGAGPLGGQPVGQSVGVIAGGSAGNNGGNYGAGGNGGGSSNSSAAAAGGNGANGYVIITEFI